MLFYQCTIGAPVWSDNDSIYLRIIFLSYSFLHASNFSISGVRCYIWLNLYFPSDSNTIQSMYNTRHWPSSIDNYVMIRIFMTFQKILGCVVFNLIPNPCKPDDIWYIIRIRRIKYGFCVGDYPDIEHSVWYLGNQVG